MRCGAGAKDGHQVDSTTSNTYRAYRFVSETHGDKLYTEFTALEVRIRAEPTSYTAFPGVVSERLLALVGLELHISGDLRGIFDVATSAADKAMYHEMVEKQFRCQGATCT